MVAYHNYMLLNGYPEVSSLTLIIKLPRKFENCHWYSDSKYHCCPLQYFKVKLQMSSDNSKTQQYYDEAWVAIFEGKGKPKAANLVGTFLRQRGYRKKCGGKAARHLRYFNRKNLLSSHFVFQLSDDEIHKNLRCV